MLCGIVRGRRGSGDLPGRIDAVTGALRSAQRAEIEHAAITVQECVLTLADIRESSHMAGIINAVTITNDSADRTQVNHAAIAI